MTKYDCFQISDFKSNMMYKTQFQKKKFYIFFLILPIQVIFYKMMRKALYFTKNCFTVCFEDI